MHDIANTYYYDILSTSDRLLSAYGGVQSFFAGSFHGPGYQEAPYPPNQGFSIGRQGCSLREGTGVRE